MDCSRLGCRPGVRFGISVRRGGAYLRRGEPFLVRGSPHKSLKAVLFIGSGHLRWHVGKSLAEGLSAGEFPSLGGFG